MALELLAVAGPEDLLTGVLYYWRMVNGAAQRRKREKSSYATVWPNRSDLVSAVRSPLGGYPNAGTPAMLND